MTKVNRLQPIRNKTANTDPDAVASSRVIQIEFIPDQHDQSIEANAMEGYSVEYAGMEVTSEVKVDPSQE